MLYLLYAAPSDGRLFSIAPEVLKEPIRRRDCGLTSTEGAKTDLEFITFVQHKELLLNSNLQQLSRTW